MRRVIVGAGAQGQVVLEVWRAQHPRDTFAFVDDNPALCGMEILGAKVQGPVALLEGLDGEAVLALGNNRTRLALASTWRDRGLHFGTVIHPSAVVSPSARIGEGTVVFAGVVVNTGARVGSQVVLNTGVIVEHDCVIHDGSSLSPGARMGGRVVIEEGVFISTGVTLAPRVRVGARSVIGAGAVVVSDLPPDVLAYGVPARVARSIEDGFDWRSVL